MSRWQRCDVSSPGGAATNGPPGRLHIALTRPAYARALLHGAVRAAPHAEGAARKRHCGAMFCAWYARPGRELFSVGQRRDRHSERHPAVLGPA
jgi:hypothetical protein